MGFLLQNIKQIPASYSSGGGNGHGTIALDTVVLLEAIRQHPLSSLKEKVTAKKASPRMSLRLPLFSHQVLWQLGQTSEAYLSQKNSGGKGVGLQLVRGSSKARRVPWGVPRAKLGLETPKAVISGRTCPFGCGWNFPLFM